MYVCVCEVDLEKLHMQHNGKRNVNRQREDSRGKRGQHIPRFSLHMGSDPKHGGKKEKQSSAVNLLSLRWMDGWRRNGGETSVGRAPSARRW